MDADASKATGERSRFCCELVTDDPVVLVLRGDARPGDADWIIDAAIEAIDCARGSYTQNLVIDVRFATFYWGADQQNPLEEAIRLCAGAGVHLMFDRPAVRPRRGASAGMGSSTLHLGL